MSWFREVHVLVGSRTMTTDCINLHFCYYGNCTDQNMKSLPLIYVIM
uniref:Uncharacterized protein n=1 Tax=Arundo donax TaxID=35708 RepID=A0A0A9BT16_ARUDO